jgi:hypothetical protein
MTGPGAAYVPFQSAPREPSHPRGISSTRAIWWIAFYPIWVLIPQAALIAIISAVGSSMPPFQLFGMILVINVALYLAMIGLVISDRRALLQGGNQSAASALWVLLSPLAYLIARSIHVRRWDASAWAPLVWWIVASILSPLIAFAAYFAVLGLLPV